MEKPILNTVSGLTITFKDTLNGWDFYQTKRELLNLGDMKEMPMGQFYDIMLSRVGMFVESVVDANGNEVAVELESLLALLSPKEVNDIEKIVLDTWSKSTDSDKAKKKE